MYFTRSQILELDDIIKHINSINSEEEREMYLRNEVEDIELFLSALKRFKKNNLTKCKKEKHSQKNSNIYTKETIMKIFEEKELSDIVAEYSKRELTDMYLTFYSSSPITSCDKTRIAQYIYQYIYAANRTKALLK